MYNKGLNAHILWMMYLFVKDDKGCYKFLELSEEEWLKYYDAALCYVFNAKPLAPYTEACARFMLRTINCSLDDIHVKIPYLHASMGREKLKEIIASIEDQNIQLS